MQVFKLVLTRNQSVIASHCLLANNAWTRMRGLLGKRSLADSEALVIEPCNSIHTFFMRFSIDVLFLDKNWCVQKIIHEIVPWRMTGICFRAKRVVELPANRCKRLDIQIGDSLELCDFS